MDNNKPKTKKNQDADAGSEVQGSDRDFCRISIEDFVSEKEIRHTIYIKLSDNRYVRVLHPGGKISPERVASYKEKGVDYLYVRTEDFRDILGFTVRVAKVAAERDLINEEKKRHFIKFTGEMIVQNAFVVGVDKEALNSARDFLESCMNVFVDDMEIFGLLDLLKDHTDYLYAHSLGVSAFSVMIGKQIGWRSPRTLFKLAFGGLFHDIGKKEIEPSILQKPRAELTMEERRELEMHVTRGKEILESMRNVPIETIRIAYEHHEDILGYGYPRHLRRKSIHPLSLIVSVANVFCEHTVKNYPGQEVKTGPEAIEIMDELSKGSLDATAYKALKSIVKKQSKAR